MKLRLLLIHYNCVITVVINEVLLEILLGLHREWPYMHSVNDIQINDYSIILRLF